MGAICSKKKNSQNHPACISVISNSSQPPIESRPYEEMKIKSSKIGPEASDSKPHLTGIGTNSQQTICGSLQKASVPGEG